ncbi:hypothetical protein McanMca71_002433 [Microsporum canis]
MGQSGRYCDLMVSEWANDTKAAEDHACSFCELGIQQVQLSSPFGYSDNDAVEFSSLTSSCSASGYSYATPTKYALNSTTAAPAPTCTSSWYTIQPDDTCVTISGAHNISTYNLIQENAMDVACYAVHLRKRLCLPQQCKVHQLGMAENCRSLVKSLNITMAQLLAWNPMINSGCTNLASWRGWYLCASSPTKTIPVQEGGSLITTAPAPRPTNAQPETNTICGQWYQVNSGDDCSSISLRYGISLQDFYFLNPQVNQKCENLWLNYSYCVKPVGDITTYSGYPVSTPSVTFTRPRPTSTSSMSTETTLPTPDPSPLAPGTIEGCYEYGDPWDEETAKILPPGTSLQDLNSCQGWAWNGEVEYDELLAWNPSLIWDRTKPAETCFLKPGYRYCIRRWKVRPTRPHDFCVEPNIRLIPPTSVQQSDCNCYVQLHKSDKDDFNCSMIPEFVKTSIPEFVALNPWIGQNCEADIFDRVSDDGFIQFCVEGSKSSSTSTVTSAPSATSLPPSTPTQPGAAKNCKKWYVVADGDTCWSITQKYGISLDDFSSWNPGVGAGCSALWLNYGVCIGL